jgi:hypothetical protein
MRIGTRWTSAPRRRLAAIGLAGAVALTACTGGDGREGEEDSGGSGDQAVDDASSDASAAAPVDDSIEDARDATRTTVADAMSAEQAEWSVAAEVSVSGFGGGDFTGEVAVAFDPAAEADPFGEFGACSGLRTELGAYSLIISRGGDAELVELATPDRVTTPGIYDADVRVERSGGPYSATGTVTLLDGLQSGSFVAFGAGGGRIEGTFDCAGPPEPTPLAVGDAGDSTLDSVEVVALLRRGDEGRVVNLATSDARIAACPAVEGGRGEAVIVSAVGTASLGSINEFELTDSSLEIVVGGTPFSFDDVSVDTVDGVDGTFGASGADGLSIDGAFRCS